jgi:organic hydroperoxide reductase OsmC/OhrA
VGEMTKNERGALWISTVTLHPQLVWSGERAPTMEEIAALHHKAHEECFIANSVKTEVRVAGVAH